MALTAARIETETGVDATRAAELLAVVTALVDGYADSAPAAIKDEAGLRAAGWLAQAPYGGQRREGTGDLDTAYSPNMTGCLSASGAKALLSPWRVRRAGSA